jgi:hypothetical protein
MQPKKTVTFVEQNGNIIVEKSFLSITDNSNALKSLNQQTIEN